MPSISGSRLSQVSNILASTESLNTISKDDDRIPVFLTKLWSIVNDSDLDHIVEWDKSGLSFHIHDSAAFSRDILPQYFKHNNLNSCIRQLNMYGFRKITAVDKKSILDYSNPANHLEFFHNYFVRDRYDLLLKIKRRTPTPKSSQQSIATTIEDMSNNNKGSNQFSRTTLMEEIKQIGKKQIETEKHIVTLKQQNETIWKEIDNLSAKCKMQQRIIKKLCSIITILGRGKQQPKIIRPKRLLAIPERVVQNTDNSNFMIVPKDDYMEYERSDESKYLKDILNDFEEINNEVVPINDNIKLFNKRPPPSELLKNETSMGNSYRSMNIQPYTPPFKYSSEINNDNLNLTKFKISKMPSNAIALNSRRKMVIKSIPIRNNCITKFEKIINRNEHSIINKQPLSIESSFCENSTPTTSKVIDECEYGYVDLEDDHFISDNIPDVEDNLIDHMSEDYLC